MMISKKTLAGMIRFTGVIIAVAIMTLSALPVDALTIEEAVRFALENNHRIKEFRSLSESSGQRVGSSRAPFWPQLDVYYSYEKMDNAFAFQTEDASTFTAEASYNLFHGFQDINQLNAAKSDYEASLNEQRAIEADIVLEARRAFIEVLREQRNVRIGKESVQLLERQRDDEENFYRAGVKAKNELLRVEVELASARQDLFRSQRNLKVARMALERIIGISIDEDEEIEEIGAIPEIDTNIENLTALMLENRSELKALRALRQARMHSKNSIKGEYYPALDFRLSHSRYGETNAFEGREGLFDDDSRALVVASWNLFSGFRTMHDVNAEEREVEALEERILDTEAEFRLRLNAALEEYHNSIDRMDVAKTAIVQAEENYRMTDNQFRESVATTRDLLDARFFLSRAQTEYNTAYYNYYLSVAAILRVIEKQQ